MMENDNGGHDNKFDLMVADALSVFSRKTSRRGLLDSTGRLFLKALGISLLPLLPLDRVFAQTQNCQGDWQYCGQTGQFCKACCNGGAAITACPNCTGMSAGNNPWVFCCCTPSCPTGGYLVKYVDCCDDATHNNSACSSNNWCTRGGDQMYWCGGITGYQYRCTVVNVTQTTCPSTQCGQQTS